ncbi:hypothetical protein HPB47_021437, partial [Ixodes persulcatus]
DDATTDLPRHISTPELVELVTQRAKKSTTELLSSRSVKVNLQRSVFEEMVLQPCRRLSEETSVSTSSTAMMLQALQLQQQQITQQNELMQAIGSCTKEKEKPKFETVKPDMFDGYSSSPEGWIDFYEYASEKNMRLFLTGIGKKWFELRLVDHPEASWNDWKASFFTSFKRNPVDRWDQAIFYKYKTGLILEYFFEKRKLLQLAEPHLLESAIISLILQGLPREIQKQVQARNLKSVEDLLQGLQDINISSNPIDRSFPPRAVAPMTPNSGHAIDRNLQHNAVTQRTTPNDVRQQRRPWEQSSSNSNQNQAVRFTDAEEQSGGSGQEIKNE